MHEPPRHAGDSSSQHLADWRWVLTPLAMFASSRAAVFLVAYVSLVLDPYVHNTQPAVESSRLVQALTRWDGGWFIHIADRGYDEPVTANFFPLFPLSGRAIAWLTGLSIPASLVVIANVCSLAAFVVVYRLFLVLDGAETATRALAVLAAWPFAFFQAAAYPESMMMLATAGATLLALRGRHVAAGLILGLGILARHLSVLAWLTLATEHVRERGCSFRRLFLSRGAVGLVLAAAVPCAYFAFLSSRFGNWHAWLDARAYWGYTARWGTYHFFTEPGARLPENLGYVVLSALPTAGAFMLLARSRWRSMAPFAIALMVVLHATGLAGLGRYSGSCWPAFLPLAAWLGRHRGLFFALICGLAAVQGVALYLWVHLYPLL